MLTVACLLSFPSIGVVTQACVWKCWVFLAFSTNEMIDLQVWNPLFITEYYESVYLYSAIKII